MGQSFLGNRLCLISSGSAPTAPQVTNFMHSAFRVPIYNGYGQTESIKVLGRDGYLSRESVKEYIVADVPELGYRSTDKPYPRGELRIKSPYLIPGYYRNEEATRQLFDEQGFMKTGDVVELKGPYHTVWIDRKNYVLKLSQGEFVSMSHLETVFMGRSPYVQQIYLYGESTRAYLLAVVVPSESALKDFRKNLKASL